MMDRSPSLSDPKRQSIKPARRKLQKCDPKLKKSKRASADSTMSQSPDNGSISSATRLIPGGAPDLSDAKWSHYLRPQTIIDTDETPESEPSPEPQALLQPPQSPQQRKSQDLQPQPQRIPEFSHLAIQDSHIRPSLDNSSLPSPTSTSSTSSTMRRQAKTPVFRIGQLEEPLAPRRSEDAREKTSSVELIADQYRALLESRDGPDASPLFSDSQSSIQQMPNPLNHPTRPPIPSRSLSRSLSRVSSLRTSKQAPSMTMDGNLTAYAPDAIYFKPVSFSAPPSPDPTPDSSPHPQQPSFARPPISRNATQGNLSLQISVDLLTRELASAIAGNPHRTEKDTAGLQIWVMIEAYERLRDQVSRLAPLHDQAGDVKDMFDVWLGSLYSIHSSLTGHTLPSPSEYAELAEGVD